MIVNLHAHTYRCGHASGTEREYLDRAVESGLIRYGFADHAPYVFSGSEYYSSFRMRPEEQEGYVTTLLRLREEYRGVIDVRIGYEAEYYPRFFEDFIRLITRFPVDYLILGQHFILNEVEHRYSGGRTEDAEKLRIYVDQVIEAMKTGYFTYIAHPDVVDFAGDPALFDEEYTRLITEAKSRDIPLEINLLGIRDNRAYPHERFFQLCGKLGAPVVIGADAHETEVAVDPASEKKAREMAARYGCTIIEDPVLVPVRP